jgi:hypothetical protein
MHRTAKIPVWWILEDTDVQEIRMDRRPQEEDEEFALNW